MTELTKVPARLAVLGSPIAHSRSPRIHAAAYSVLGLDWSYEARRCEVAELGALLDASEPEWRGFSVTMPLKEEAFRRSAILDPVATESGVVNTLFRLVGTGPVPAWAGFNTDVAGLAAALRGANFDLTRTVVLGAGATAVSAVLAARALGAEHVTVLARRPAAAAALASRFDGTHEPGASGPVVVSASTLGPTSEDADRSLLAQATAVISTLPGPVGETAQVPAELFRVPLFDVAYDPWPSPLAARWVAAGGTAHAGIDMLVEQALVQVRIFVNGDPSLPLEREAEVHAAMRDAGVGG